MNCTESLRKQDAILSEMVKDTTFGIIQPLDWKQLCRVMDLPKS